MTSVNGKESKKIVRTFVFITLYDRCDLEF